MTRLFRAVALACAIALAGCAGIPGGPPQSDAERAYATACGTLAPAHAAFLVYAAFNDVDAKAREIEATAYASASAVCEGPLPRDLTSALAAITRALAAIAAARQS